MLSSFSPLAANVRSTSHILTSRPFPATANEVDDVEAVARQVTGAVSVRDFEDEDEEGWYVKRPDDKADMAPLANQLGYIYVRQTAYPCTAARPVQVDPFR
jgi:hypothetical protein